MLALISIKEIAKKCQKKKKISRNTLDVDEKHCSNQIVSFVAIIRNIDCYRFLLSHSTLMELYASYIQNNNKLRPLNFIEHIDIVRMRWWWWKWVNDSDPHTDAYADSHSQHFAIAVKSNCWRKCHSHLVFN